MISPSEILFLPLLPKVGFIVSPYARIAKSNHEHSHARMIVRAGDIALQ